MLLTLAIAAPPTSHFIYIPAVVVLGFTLGFMLGAKATRDNIALQARRDAERDERRKAREERDKARDKKQG